MLSLPAPFDDMPDDVGLEEASNRSIVLRAPSFEGTAVRPGVLLITFTNTNRYYFHHVDLARLQEYFCVVLEPSWAGYALPEVLCWTRAPRPVVVQSSEVTDRQFLDALDTNLIPVEFGASDWVDHRIFHPLDLERTYDATYVANYSAGKRVHVFLRAVSRLRAHGFRAALVCARWGGERDTVHRLIAHYGVGDSIDVFEDQPPADVNRLLNRSKCNILLSLKEGSNRSLFEAMFAGTPTVLLRENVGVNKDHINEHTGLLTSEGNLSRTLLAMRECWPSFDPRGWAMSNISPEVTTRRLGERLEELFPDVPGGFGDLLVKRNAPEVRYFEQALDEVRAGVTRRVLEAFAGGSGDPQRVRDAIDHARRALQTAAAG